LLTWPADAFLPYGGQRIGRPIALLWHGLETMPQQGLSPWVEKRLMRNSSGAPSLDLTTLTRLHQTGTLLPEETLQGFLARAATYPDPAVWTLRLPDDAIRKQIQAVSRRRATGEQLPLYGVPFAVKDNIDVAGYATTAGCPAFSYVAEQTAPVVARLLEAGAILVGKTNLDQFATGLAGDRSPYGACRNPFDPAFISGGSSSGSGVAVAGGLVSFALGTDTAGSGRVPAACTNIVGLKPTPGRLDTTGVVPACRSLDCVSVLALTSEDAMRVYGIARGKQAWTVDREPWTANRGTVPASRSTVHGFTFATPGDEDLEFFGDDDQTRLFAQSVDRLEQMGGLRGTIDFGPLREVAALLYEGPWVAERLAGVEPFMVRHAAEMHPVTRLVMESGAAYSAVDFFKALARLKRLRPTCQAIFEDSDVLVVPSIPTLPTLAAVQADSRGWSKRLGHYTNFVNLLGWAALALPSGFTPRGLPGGITLIGPADSEDRLTALGMMWQRRTNLPLGATGKHLPPERAMPTPPLAHRSTIDNDGGGMGMPPEAGYVRVAVAGAHLRGQPLHADLLQTGARLVRACRTAAGYRFVALMDLNPPRPGLLRDGAGAGAIAVELYDLPLAGFGKLVASVAPPLAIGTVELEDGEAVKGFLCESWAAAEGRDITTYGGWVTFLASLK
jgi:allophanate hydrolase